MPTQTPAPVRELDGDAAATAAILNRLAENLALVDPRRVGSLETSLLVCVDAMLTRPDTEDPCMYLGELTILEAHHALSAWATGV